MGIRLVYGLRTGDASYLDIFYPSRRLKESALASGLDYAAIIHRPSDPVSRILDFCQGSGEGHLALLRGELPDSLYSRLESEGVLVVNPAKAVALARDKLASSYFFNRLGCRHPRTLKPLVSDKGLPLPLPFVAKPRFGKMGRGVALIENPGQWEGYLADADRQGQAIIAQAYVETSSGQDIRFFFAAFRDGSGTGSVFKEGCGQVAESGGRAVPGWICVKRKSTGFLSNAHAGGTMSAFRPPESLRREAERIFSLSGLVYGTVDFLLASRDEKDFSVCELNANPGFEELERSLNLDAASAILTAASAFYRASGSAYSGSETPGGRT